ncbi:serine/threonine protein kinase, partial [Candidatus Thiomargarita nelsonii]
NDRFQAAWIFAQQAKLFNRARSILQQVTIKSVADELSRDLILACCEAGNGKAQQAGIYLHSVISQFDQLTHNPRCQQIEQWAVTVGKQIDRPDLIASIYAAADLAGSPKVEQRWEAWAMERLGDATGVPLTPSPQSLEIFEFEVVTVNERGEIIDRRYHQASQSIEDVNGVAIEMVYVPGGTFLMGSPETEEGKYDDEGPQHQVTIAPFYMSKYPVTQAQWQAVMGNNPSEFKGENRPVEQVSWDDAVAFCQKLSEITGKDYRLPSEAQWEYACRAGTTTPFYFGETITTDLANYDGHFNYASEPEGTYREETTSVGIFPPNAFGLYDMHGNLWEWCADPWHHNYQGAPSDGSVWEKGGASSR